MQTTLTPTPAHEPPLSPPPSSDTPERVVRWREMLGAAAFESTFVVLGVVLALAANEWREARINRAAGESARVAIVNELTENRRLLEESRTYHRSVTAAVNATPADAAPPRTAFSRGFIMPAQLSTTAWEVASETGALSHIPYQQVLAISQVVALERRYDAMSLSTGQLIYGELYRSGPTGIMANARNLASIISAFSFRENQLITQIDSTLAQLAR